MVDDLDERYALGHLTRTQTSDNVKPLRGYFYDYLGPFYGLVCVSTAANVRSLPFRRTLFAVCTVYS